jgi:hypothetical protein
MPPQEHGSLPAQVRAAIDAALVKALTSGTTAMEHVRPDVADALGLLAETDATGISPDTVEAIRAADEHLRAGRWDDARCALVTARGRLARPDAPGSPARHRASE